jgi:DNA modification methylase
MKLADLKPALYNPRTISKEAAEGLIASMTRFGLVDPLIVNKRTGYTIVGGHQRYAIMQQQGLKEAQVVLVDLSEPEERALNVTLNNPHIAGDWSDELVSLLDQIRSENNVDFEGLRLDKLLRDFVSLDQTLHNADPSSYDKNVKIETNKIIVGDCLDVMKQWPSNCIDTVITDPPYGLSFMSKGWDGALPGTDIWREVLRIAKPGSILLAFGGTRTWHRLTSAIEDAGWEIHDCMMWLYGSGFPKSHDISKALDARAGARREVVGYKRQGPRSMFDGGKPRPATLPATLWNGWGTALKPAWEPIILAMKPLDGTFAENAERWGVSGLNIDGGRIGIEGGSRKANPAKRKSVTAYGDGLNGGGVELIDAGRWPANLILDEDSAAQLDQQSGVSKSPKSHERRPVGPAKATWSLGRTGGVQVGHDDFGGASRFFYTAKASTTERNAGLEGMNASPVSMHGAGIGQGRHPEAPTMDKNFHPTVKPLSLMKYLCTLTKTPTGGIVFDPFAGSGSTLIAAKNSGRPYLGIEINSHYAKIARARIEKI